MPVAINDSDLKNYGISTNHEIMDNGQKRFRLLSSDGSSYIRCESPGVSVWENSHSHSTLQEMIIVQKGCVVFAEYINGKVIFKKLVTGDFSTTIPGIPHNACLSPNTVVHTIKFGDCSQPDWIPSVELDLATKGLTFEEALAQA